MPSEKLFATVRIKANCKNCFVELSQCLARQCKNAFSDHLPEVIGIENDVKNVTFVSWIPREVNDDAQSKQIIYIGKSFADCIGLKDHDMVFLHSVLNISSCQKVCVAPINHEEWEILDINSHLIEQSMLEQIRLVHPGLEFPLFLKGAAVVVLRIESIEPGFKAGFLEEFTELHIAPKPKSISSSAPRKTTQGQAARSSSVKSLPSFNRRKKPKDSDKMDSIWSYLFGVGVKEETSREDIANIKSTQKTMRNDKNEPPSKETHFHDVLRVNPFWTNKQRTNNGCLQNCTAKPFSLCVNMDFLNSIILNCNCVKINREKKCVLKVSKMSSPREKDEEKKKQRKGGSSESKTERVAFVELAVEERVACSSIDQSRWTSVSDEVMAYFDAEQGSLLSITCAHQEASQLHDIAINVIDAKGQRLTERDVSSMFHNWIQQRLHKDDKMLVMSSMLINMEDVKGGDVFAVVDFHAAKKGDELKETYFFIDKNILEDVLVVVKFHNDDGSNEHYQTLQNYFKREESPTKIVGGFNELIKEGISFIHDSLQRPSLQRTLACRHNGSLLICGSSRTTASGCGRTSLWKSICDHFKCSPYFCHVELIDCIPLRGKKPETILHRFSVAMEEAKWKQPSIIVFDDLDCLMKQPDPVKDAQPTIVYHSRLAEGLKDLLRKEIASDDVIAVVFISKTREALHEIFSAPSGWHFIGCSLKIRPPDEETREEMINVIIDRMHCEFLDDTFPRKCSRSTEGFLPADLEIVLKRAKNAAIRRNLKSEFEELAVTEEDFHEALVGYKPIGLHGVELHKPGKLGWTNVGGLSEAKKILKETFVWPMKYKGLFSKCPFRMRSGVLLYGPSGTGKTLLAGIVAKECGMNFVSIKGPELLSKYVGSSEQNVRDLFARAQSASPCILFFDEFDALAPKRGHDNTGVTDRVVNQLLTQLDGVEKLDNVFILAATSRPDLIDPALLRPGRLDKCVYCPMPDVKDRLEILECLSKDLDTVDGINWLYVSQRTANFSGADLKALLYNAQLRLIHEKIPLTKGDTLTRMDEIKELSLDFSMKLSEEDIIEALQDTNPSVSAAEIQKNEMRFENFVASRQCKTSQIDAGMRVTLA